MGGLLGKGVPDPVTGMTERERRAVEQTWSQFVKANPEYGVVVFSALFEHHPDYLKLFPAFRGKQLQELEHDAKFRAHGCAVGYQLSSMVDSMRDPVLLDALIRKNATAHLERKGVGPFHFQSLGKVVIEVLKSEEEKTMTPVAVEGWEKLFALMLNITLKVYEERPPDSGPAREDSHKSPDRALSSPSSPIGASDRPRGARRHQKKGASAKSSRANSPLSSDKP